MDKPPEKTKGDAAHAVTKAVAGMVPVAGSALTVMLETILAPPLERRREKWFQKLAEAVTELQGRLENFSPETLSNNEVFVTAVAQATQVALRTHQDEKLASLKQAVIHSALPNAPTEDQQLLFLRFVEELTPWHLRLLGFFDGPAKWMERNNIKNPGWSMGGPGTVVELCFPDLKKQQEFLNQIVRDLQTRGLIQQGQFMNVTMTGDGMLASRITEFGRRFLAFVNEG